VTIHYLFIYLFLGSFGLGASQRIPLRVATAERID
jgi:hypothetical protein